MILRSISCLEGDPRAHQVEPKYDEWHHNHFRLQSTRIVGNSRQGQVDHRFGLWNTQQRITSICTSPDTPPLHISSHYIKYRRKIVEKGNLTHPYSIQSNSSLKWNMPVTHFTSCLCPSLFSVHHHDQADHDIGHHHLAWHVGDLTAAVELGSPIPFCPHLVSPSALLPPKCVTWQASSVKIMARKASGKKPATQAPEDPPGRRPSKDLRRAAETARSFKQGTSSQAQQEIQDTADLVWQKVEEAKYDGQLDEFKQWVNDPGYTTGRLALYDRALAYYWAAMQVCGKVMDKRTEKELAEQEPTKCWRPHYRETHMIHIKIDAIANKLGMPFLPKDSAANMLNNANQNPVGGPSAPPEPPE